MATRVETVEEALEMAVPAIVSQYLRDPDSTHVFAPLIEGPPGIGKSATLSEFAQKLNIKKVVIISCGVIDPNLEFIGLPEVIKPRAHVEVVDVEKSKTMLLDHGEADKVLTKWIKPERLAQFDILKPDERGLLVFDDMHFLLQQQQAMLMQLLTNAMTVHTHRIGSGNNVAVMFIANRLEDNAGAQEMLSPVIDRIKRIIIDYDAVKGSREWVKWAEEQEELHPSVINFVKKNPELFYTFKPDEIASTEEISTQKFASPRTYDYLAREIEIAEALLDPERRRELVSRAFPQARLEVVDPWFEEVAKKILRGGKIANFAAGTVGEKAAREFAAYYEVYSKYDLEEYIKKARKGEEEFDIPAEELSIAAARLGYETGRKLTELEVTLQEKLFRSVFQLTPKEAEKFFVLSDEVKKTAEENDIDPESLEVFLEVGLQSLKKNRGKSLEEIPISDRQQILHAYLLTEAYETKYPGLAFIELLKEAQEKDEVTVENVLGTKLEKRLSKTEFKELASEYADLARFVKVFIKTAAKAGVPTQPIYSTFFGSLTNAIRKHSNRFQEKEKLLFLPREYSTMFAFVDTVFEAVRSEVSDMQKFDRLIRRIDELAEDLSASSVRKKSSKSK